MSDSAVPISDYLRGLRVHVVCVFACDATGALACDGVEIAEAHWIPGPEVPALLSLPYPAKLFV